MFLRHTFFQKVNFTKKQHITTIITNVIDKKLYIPKTSFVLDNKEMCNL